MNNEIKTPGVLVRLTPWTLTVATFLMVGGIALMYFFKRSGLRAPQQGVPVSRVYVNGEALDRNENCLLYTSPSPRD